MAFYSDDELPIAFRRPRGGELQRKAAPAETGAELGQCRVLTVRGWIIWWKWAMAAVSSSKGIAVISS
jgi:hypothetical protein